MNILKLAIPATLSCLCNTIANTLWKLQLSNHPFNITSKMQFIESVFNLRIIGGVCFYGISMLLFFYILSNFRLSQAVPFLATTYVFNFITASLIFKEVINIKQIVGIILIITGIIISNI